MGRAVRDRERHQSGRLARRIEVDLATHPALVVDLVLEGWTGSVRSPFEAPEGLVEMGVRFDETGQDKGAVEIDHRDRRRAGALAIRAQALDDRIGSDRRDAPGADQNVLERTARWTSVAQQQVSAHGPAWVPRSPSSTPFTAR